MSTLQIIRTAAGLEALDGEAVLYRSATSVSMVNVLQARQVSPIFDLPAVVIATGDQVRAARKALEGEA